jgi:heme/copper-type cytochrome/quinol oxidase subunit 4
MMLKGSVRVFLVRVRGYVGENWGAPFVVGFMLLLTVAAVCLASGLKWWANEVAMYAYYSLVVGVVLQVVCFLKTSAGKKERQKTE